MVYQDFSAQYERSFAEKKKENNLSKGLYAFALGLGKKILIADMLGKFVNAGFSSGYTEYNSVVLILLILSYTLQIYFDFSGYSDMAVGLGLMLNIRLPQNFNSPYKAMSINDFWKRWHMSLTSFFTKYLYIPLGGNRKGEARTYLNVMIVFLLSGLWHGANYTFLLWGILHGIASAAEKKFKYVDKLHAALQWMYTFCFVNIAWLFFRADSISQAIAILRGIFQFDFTGNLGSALSAMVLPEISFLLNVLHWEQYIAFVPVIFLFILVCAVLQCRNTDEKIQSFQPTVFKLAVTIFIMSWCVLSFGEKVTFIYEMF